MTQHSEAVSKLIDKNYKETAQHYPSKDEALQVYWKKMLENSLLSWVNFWVDDDPKFVPETGEYTRAWIVTSTLDLNDEQKELYLKDCADKGIEKTIDGHPRKKMRSPFS